MHLRQKRSGSPARWTGSVALYGLSRTAQISKGEKGRLSAIEAEETGELALAGLFVADADPIVGDHLGRYSSWRGEEKLSCSPDSPVLIRFRMRAAELFSVEFV